jgi:hypothetical protein
MIQAMWSRSNTSVSTWFERDRAMVCLSDTNETTILIAWDSGVAELVEDGFLDPRDWHGSAVEYANHLGLTASELGAR